jgi:hypothetical protein
VVAFTLAVDETCVNFSKEPNMKMMMSIAAAVALAAAVGVTSASAAPGDTYKVKKKECQERAKGQDFGVHLIKKNRWVKDCIAGKH